MLDNMGITALILDVDNTMTTHDNPTPADGIDEWLDSMRAHGIRMTIVSNNHAPRVIPFAERLGLSYIPEGAKPLPRGYKKALAAMGAEKSETAAIGDQLFTDILGANLFGISSILVPPIEPEKSLFFKVKRTLEKPFLPKKYQE